MKRAIRIYAKNFAAIVAIALISVLVGGVILSHQRLTLPHWVPVLGSDYVNYKVELPTAQSLTPGQGQTVDIAGVPIGEITKVDLYEGKALVTVKIKRKYTPIPADSTILVRPKTGLNDMILELTPGKGTRMLPANGKGTIPVAQSLSNVNLDEILAALDGDTRSYLQLLLGGASEGLKGRATDLAAAFKRFDPTNRDVEKITGLLAKRRTNISRTVHNFNLLSQALAGKDSDLSALIESSNQVFKAFADQDQNLRSTLQELPSALQATQVGLRKADTLAKVTGSTLQALRPGARALGPSLKQTRPFLKTTTPIIKNQLRPFSRDALPTVKLLRPAAHDLATITPALTESVGVINTLLNEIAYDKPNDGNESYLFYLAWANHIANTVFATQDAHGPVRRGLLVLSCSSIDTLNSLAAVNDQLGVLIKLLSLPLSSDVCPKTSQAGNGSGSTRSSGGLSPLSPDAPKLAADTGTGQ